MPNLSIIEAMDRLSQQVDKLTFSQPITHVYNPLSYARDGCIAYIQQYASAPKKVIFVGMNPGPWGMAQTGIPFGEIPAVRDWLNIDFQVQKDRVNEHPKRPIEGMACKRSEVSGRRLWGLFAERFGTAKDFFKDHYVFNYCPLVFMEASGKNFTPDKLPVSEQETLYKVCDQHFYEVVKLLKPTWVIGVGAFSQARAYTALKSLHINIGKILHPSPASPAANRGWAQAATKELIDQGVWTESNSI